MKRFNHLESGMSFIEVIAAIGILAIFGSSIFLMQEYLFARIQIAQHAVIANFRMQSQLVEYQRKILEEMLVQEGQVEKSIAPSSKEFTHPDMTISITTRSKFEQKEYKDLRDLYLISVQASKDKKEYGKLYRFIFIPKIEKKAEKK